MAARLTERDRWLCEMLFQHRVLTTNQVCDLAFDNLTTTRHRLSQLHGLRLVDRFRPIRLLGSAPFHYVLDDVGADVVAAGRGIERDQLTWRRDRSLAIATSQRLGHLVGTNGFFTSLVRSARDHPGAQLLDWWSEQRCGAAWGDFVRPDGYGRWVDNGTEVAFFLEFDGGTERLHRIAAKMAGYADLQQASSQRRWVLIVVPGPRRESEARRALRPTLVPVATSSGSAATDPAAAVWLPVGQEGPRLGLLQLGRSEAAQNEKSEDRYNRRSDSDDVQIAT